MISERALLGAGIPFEWCAARAFYQVPRRKEARTLSTRIEIGIDSVKPELLAPFWAEALGYTIGDMDRGGDVPRPRAPGAGDAGRLPAARPRAEDGEEPAPSRSHDRRSRRKRLSGSGLAGRQASGTPRPGSEGGWWQVMADPEGNEFCVCRVE